MTSHSTEQTARKFRGLAMRQIKNEMRLKAAIAVRRAYGIEVALTRPRAMDGDTTRRNDAK
jgi:hypothetical protein